MSIALRRTAAVAATVISLLVVFVSASAPSGAATSIARQSSGSGYWLAAADGGVFAFGTAHFYGSMAGKHLNAPITGIVATADDHGYWLVAKDGAVFAFGNAQGKGSMGGKPIAAPIVDMAASNGSGAAGARGATGPRGATGAAATSSWAYVYNNAAQTVAIEASVLFDTNGQLRGFTHAPGSAAITATTAGVYRVDFSISGTEANQFALFVNGTVATGTIAGSGAGTQQNDGQSIRTLAAGDVLTVRNHSSAAAVGLPTVAGGVQTNVNASVVIQRLG